MTDEDTGPNDSIGYGPAKPRRKEREHTQKT